MVQYINEHFVPIEVNLSKTGFPSELPGLKPWMNAYQKDWRFQMAFATTVVLSEDGRWPLGTSGSGYRNEFATAANYHPDQFLSFLKEARQRATRIASVQNDPNLNGWQRAIQMQGIRKEILQQLHKANHKGGHFGNGFRKAH